MFVCVRNEFAVIQSFNVVIVLIYLRDYSSRPVRGSKSGNVSRIIPELTRFWPSIQIVPYTCYNRGYSICNTWSSSSSSPRSSWYRCSGSPASWWHILKVYENRSHYQVFYGRQFDDKNPCERVIYYYNLLLISFVPFFQCLIYC